MFWNLKQQKMTVWKGKAGVQDPRVKYPTTPLTEPKTREYDDYET